MVDLRRHAMDAEDGDVGAMHGAAHIEAASESDAQLRGQVLMRKAVAERVHDALHDARGIRSCRVTMHPALGVHDVADRVVGASDREPVRGQFLFQGLDLRFVLEQELNIVAAGEAEVAAAVLVRQRGEKAQRLNAGEPRRGGANRVETVTGLRHVAENARRHVLVIFPLAIVLLDQRRQKLVVTRRADVGESGLSGRRHLSPPCAFWK